jgi:hypothetical protein
LPIELVIIVNCAFKSSFIDILPPSLRPFIYFQVEVGRPTGSCIVDTSLNINDDPKDPEPCSMNENSKINIDSEDQRQAKETCTADEETDSASGNYLNEFPIRSKGPHNDDKSEDQGTAHETCARDEETDSASGNELAESHILDNGPNINDESKDQSTPPKTSTDEERMVSTSGMVLAEVLCAKETRDRVPLEDSEVVVDEGVGPNSTDILDRPLDEDLKEVTYESIMAAANDSSPPVEKSFEERSKTSSSSTSRSINGTAASFTSIHNEEALIHSNITDDEQSVEKGLEVGGPVSNDPFASIVISSSGK